MLPTSTSKINRQEAFKDLARAWSDRGCSPRVATALANAGVERAEQIAQLGRAYFRQSHNCGPVTLTQIGDLIGGWPGDRPTPQQAMAQAFSLALPTASESERLELAADAVAALYRSHYAICARQERRKAQQEREQDASHRELRA